MNITIYFFLLLIPFYIGVYYFQNKKKKKLEEDIQRVDFKRELLLADQYKEELLSNDLSYVKKQMKGEPIDAFNYANISYSTKDALKDGMKDSLKSLATLGTVRYTTVQTAKFLVLCNGELHLLETDTDGDISNHFIFNSLRLQNSSIREIELSGTDKAFAKQKSEDVKGYILSLATDEKPVEILVYSSLVFNFSSNDVSKAYGGFFSTDNKKIVKEIVIANQFLQKLGELYPNMKVRVPILNS